MKPMKQLKNIFYLISSVAILLFSLFLLGVVLKFLYNVFLLGWRLW